MNKIKRVYRHEKKYILNWNEFLIINNKLKYLLRLDKNCPKEGYEVKSLYFDNPYNFALAQKIDGDETRHKYRIRVYNDNFSYLKLERKSKYNVMTNKESVFLTKKEAEQIVSGDVDFLQKNTNYLLQDFYFKVKKQMYSPKTIVKYSRIAYVYPVSNLRVTFDFKIERSNNVDKFFTKDNGYMKAYDPNSVVMEIKFDDILPRFIRDSIQLSNVVASSSSKYVTARLA